MCEFGERRLMGRFIGIDLGTTNSVIAVMDGPRARILETSEGRRSAKSVVGLRVRRGRDGTRSEILVCDVAYDYSSLAPTDTIMSIKRLMGRGVADTEVELVKKSFQYQTVAPSDGTKDSVRVILGGSQYSPIQISAMILRKLKADAEICLNAPVTHAVITVPAYFSQIQKSATRKAGIEAGLRVIKILDEPSAAAVAYGISDEDTAPRVVMVYDLGGGTFDISILMVAGGSFTTLGVGGDMWLGGDRFDEALVAYALRTLREDYPEVDPEANPKFMGELRKAAQRAKETLSSVSSADIIVANLLQGPDGPIDLNIEVTREEYEDLIRPLVDRTIGLVRQALKDYDLTEDSIDRVLMAGNSTMTPLVQSAVAGVFGRPKVLRTIHPKECVALGAAIVAAVLGGRMVCGAPDEADASRECGEVNPSDAETCQRCGSPLAGAEQIIDAQGRAQDLVVQSVAPFHYGARSANDQFTVFVRKGDPYPTADPQMQEFLTPVAGARTIAIPIYGGEDLSCASKNERQGEAFAILPPGLPKGTSVRIRLWLDDDGVFKLSGNLADGRDLSPLVVEKGEALDRAITTLEQVEERLGSRDLVDLQDTPEVEAIRERTFEHMRRGREKDALVAAENLQEVVAGLGRTDVSDKAEQLMGFTEFIVGNYSWAFSQGRIRQLHGLVESVRAARKPSSASDLEALVQELDHETDDLPIEVQMLLSVRQIIGTQINPYDPARAAALGMELAQVEDGLRGGNAFVAQQRMAGLLQEVEAAYQAAPPPAGGRGCKNGHRYYGGRYCPTCNADAWELVGKSR
jgi:molecular chaperone DnaK